MHVETEAVSATNRPLLFWIALQIRLQSSFVPRAIFMFWRASRNRLHFAFFAIVAFWYSRVPTRRLGGLSDSTGTGLVHYVSAGQIAH